MVEPTAQEPEAQHSHGHDHDEHDGTPCLHCMLHKAYDDWEKTQGDTIPADKAGYGLGQFMSETINDLVSNTSHEISTAFLSSFHQAQKNAAEVAEADGEIKH